MPSAPSTPKYPALERWIVWAELLATIPVATGVIWALRATLALPNASPLWSAHVMIIAGLALALVLGLVVPAVLMRSGGRGRWWFQILPALLLSGVVAVLLGRLYHGAS